VDDPCLLGRDATLPGKWLLKFWRKYSTFNFKHWRNPWRWQQYFTTKNQHSQTQWHTVTSYKPWICSLWK